LGVFAAAAIGIIVDRWGDMPLRIWACAFGVACTAWIILTMIRRIRLAGYVVLALVVSSGGAWHHVRWNSFHQDDVAFRAPPDSTPVLLRAVALETPRYVPETQFDPLSPIPRGEQTRLNVRATAIMDGDQWKPCRGVTVLFVKGVLRNVEPGDQLLVRGKLQGSRLPRNPGEFSLHDHRRGDRRLARVSVPHVACLTIEEGSSAWHPRWWLARVRGRLAENLNRFIAPRNRGLALALLLGQRDRLQRDQVDQFFVTGTIHLLAISGLHVSILAMVFVYAGRSRILPDRAMIWAVIGLALAYALITAARAPILRAAILLEVSCLSQLIRRRGSPINALAAAGLVVLWLNPTQLFNAGAQLSFLAVTSLSWSASRLRVPVQLDPLQRLIENSRSGWERWLRLVGRSLRETFIFSAVVWLVTLPLVMHRFNIVSPWAIFLNLILWIPLSAALISGFLTMLLGFVFPPLGRLGGFICDANLDLLQACVRWVAELPVSHFWVAGLGGIAVAGFYMTLAVVAAWRPAKPYWWLCMPACYLWLALGAWGPRFLPRAGGQNGEVQMTFLSVGHGTCVVCELPDRRTLVYDAGCLGSPQRCANAVSRFLWGRGIRHLDWVVLSHADADHYNALPILTQRFSIGEICATPTMFDGSDWGLDRLRQELAEARVPIREVKKGNAILDMPGASVKVIHPTDGNLDGGDNANSLVLRIDVGDVRILLPGDLEGAGMDSVLGQPPVDCDLVLAPHHGSPRSLPRQFVEWCSPEWVVISGGGSRDVDKVCQAYEQEGLEVRHTARHGAVFVSVDRGEVHVESWWEPSLVTEKSRQPIQLQLRTEELVEFPRQSRR